jgi:hypothetical protein
MVYNRMRHFGEGHDNAANYVNIFIDYLNHTVRIILIFKDDQTEMKIAQSIENESKAQHRGTHAIKVHRVEKMIKENKENSHIISR